MPASIVRCTNRACPHRGVDRRVEMVEAGDGLYARPAVVCACGQTPTVVDRDLSITAAPSAPERAVRSAPEQRTKTAARRR